MPNNSTAIQPDDLIKQETIQRLNEFKVVLNEVVLINNKLERATIAVAKAYKNSSDKQYVKLQRELEIVENKRKKLLRTLNVESKKNSEITLTHIKNNVNLKKAISNVNIELSKQNKLAKESSTLGSKMSGALSWLKGASAFALALAGLDSFISKVKEAYTVLKKLDSVKFQIGILIKDPDEQIRTMGFLSDLSNKFGADILSLSENYIRFITASKDSNISLKETEAIYSAIVKAGSLLGKNQYEIESSLLAVEQMMSKGKVTTEELRRQLGERLPGAMAIMAKAAGVNVEELDKMLRKGEVISKDILPKFAVALEEAYGIDKLESIENLQAAQNRSTNAWTNFVRRVEEGSGIITRALKGIFELSESIADLLADPTQLEIQSNEYRIGYDASYSSIKKQAELNKKTIEEYAKEQVEIARKYYNQEIGEYNKYVARYNAARNKFVLKQKQVSESSIGYNDIKLKTELIKAEQKFKQAEDALNKTKANLSAEKGIYQAYLDIINKKDAVVNKTTDTGSSKKISYFEGKDLLTFNEKLIALLKEEKDAYESIYKAEKSSLEQKLGALNAIQSVESDLAKLERDNEILKLDTNYKNDIEQYNKAVFKSEDEKLAYKQKLEDYYQYYREVAEENYQIKLREFEAEKNENSIKALEEYYKNELELVKNKYDETEDYHIEALDKLYADGLITTEEYENNKKELTLKYLTESVNAQIEILKKLYEFYNSIGDEKMVSEIGAKIAELYNQLTDLPDNLKENKDKLKDFLKEVKDYAEKIYDSIAELVNTIYDANINRLEGMKDKMEEYYDKQYELAEGDAEQQRLIQLEKEKEERKINARIRKEKIKQAQAEKIFAALKIQIDTAAAVIGFLKNPGGVYGLALSIMAGTLGAINLGRVAAAKIPEYKYGTENHKGGAAYVGDGGVREVVEDGDKTWITPNEKTLVYLNKGAKVYSSEDKYKVALRKSRLRNETSHTTTSNQQNHPNYSKDIKNGFKGVKLVVINNIDDYKTRNTQF